MTTTQTATKARKTGNRTPAKAPVSKFNADDLPATGTVQFRQGGDYKPSIRALSAFAKGNPVNMGHVKALIHLGWVKPGGVNAASKSTAFTLADNAELPEASWSVGSAAAPQISANLLALAEAGAPEEALNGLWAAYVGTI
ncbi:MAG: hypothetical protein M3Q75_02130 [Gemmatimonadota bacterium]|nr:hypothetical protein [Gemmatimonadota bacterium]